MSYTYSITRKGQITIPKEFRDRLDLDKMGKATFRLNDKDEVVISKPKTLEDIRLLLRSPTSKDQLSEKERIISSQLLKKHNVG